MKGIGRELTEKGFKKVKEMDIDGNGKIEEGEVNLGEDLEGDDYSANNKHCIGCFILNCVASFSCFMPGGTINHQKTNSDFYENRKSRI